MKLIALFLGEGITANLLAPSACGLQSFPRTHPEPSADSFESADSGLRSTGLGVGCPIVLQNKIVVLVRKCLLWKVFGRLPEASNTF